MRRILTEYWYILFGGILEIILTWYAIQKWNDLVISPGSYFAYFGTTWFFLRKTRDSQYIYFYMCIVILLASIVTILLESLNGALVQLMMYHLFSIFFGTTSYGWLRLVNIRKEENAVQLK